MRTMVLKPWAILAVLLLIGLSACKMDLSQEIWLNADESGHARLEASVSIPRLSEEDTDISGMDQDNALQDFADRIADNPGAQITVYESNTDHSPDEYRYLYELEFTFDNLQTLRNVICIDSTKGFNVHDTKRYKLLSVELQNFLMQQEGDTQEYLNLLDIEMDVVINLPTIPQRIDSKTPATSTGKQISWSFALDEEWYKKVLEPILIMF